MAVTEADRVLARGRELVFGGKSYVFKFDLESLAELEDIYGDNALLSYAADLDRQSFKAAFVGLTVGLAHTGMLLGSRKALVRSFSPEIQRDRRLAEVILQVGDAFVEGLPAPAPTDVGKADGEGDGSPGPLTTSSPSSASAAPSEGSAA